MLSTFNIPKSCKFPLLRQWYFCLEAVVLFLPSYFLFRFSSLAWLIFLCQISSLYIYCISSLPVLGFPILYHVWQTVWDFAYLSLEISIRLFFFPFLFSGYFPSVDVYVVCIVSGCCNQSFSALFIKSSSRFTDVSTKSWMLESPLLPIFFTFSLWYKVWFLCLMAYCCIVGSIKAFQRYKPKSWQVYQRAINAFSPK